MTVAIKTTASLADILRNASDWEGYRLLADIIDEFPDSPIALQLTEVNRRMALANGKRRERTLTIGDGLWEIREVGRGLPWSYEDGGTVANAYSYRAYTTLVLSVRIDGRVFFDATVSDAKSVTPGRGWSVLKPWRRDSGPIGNAAGKFAAWSATAIDCTDLAGFLGSL